MKQILKKKYMRPTAGILAAALVCGGVGVGISVSGTGSRAAEVTDEAGAEAQVTAVSYDRMGFSEADQRNLSKDETVYVLADADGSAQKVIVSEWIRNAMKSSQISDRTELSDIENVKGTETFTQEKDGLGVWDAQGNDIYYQGSIEKELPVEMRISCQLDGKTVSPEELAGQSGHVVLRFDYTNRQKETAEINGRQEELFVPFAVLTTALLDNERFRNVEVTNGKVINDGEHLIAVGCALPGLQESLDVKKEDLDLPDYVEISADVTDFSLTTTLTVVTNEVFSELDLDETDSLDELQDAMNELMDGCGELYDGICELYDKSGELKDGIDKLKDGADELDDGAGTLNSGAGALKDGAAKLQSGAQELNEGLNTLTGNNAALNAGAKQVFETLLDTAQSQLEAAEISNVPDLTIENYGQVLEQIAASMSPETVKALAEQQARAAVTQQVEANRPAIEAAVEAAIKEQIRQAILQGQQAGSQESSEQQAGEQQDSGQQIAGQQDGEALKEGESSKQIVEETPETMNGQTEGKAQVIVKECRMVSAAAGAGTDALEAAVDAQFQTPEIQAQYQAAVENAVQKKIEEAMQSESVQSQIQAAVLAAANGGDSLKTLKSSLDSYNQFYQGLLAYTAGVASASIGSRQLADGSKELYQGLAELYSGSGELKDGTGKLRDGAGELKNGGNKLIDGVLKLKDGGLELKDGAEEFNEKGIQKLTDTFDGDVQSLIDRMKAICDLSREYRSFAGISDEMEGSVKFIYKTEAVEP